MVYSLSELLVRLWRKLDDVCEKYLKANKEYQ